MVRAGGSEESFEMNNKLKLIADDFGRDRVKFNEPIASYTALKAGGPAKLFFVAFTQNELIKMIRTCWELKVPVFLFGTGSKIMISDHGFDGVVVKNRTKEVQVVSIKGKVSKFGIGVEEALIKAESGVSIAKLVEFLSAQDLLTSSFANIPGSLGGNLFLNQFLQSSTESIRVLNQEGKIETIPARTLSLKKHIIISAILRVKSK